MARYDIVCNGLYHDLNFIISKTGVVFRLVYKTKRGAFQVTTTLQLKNIGLFMNLNATENNVYAMQKDYGSEMRKIEVIF